MPSNDMSLTEAEIEAYRRDGYVLRRGLFAPDEVALISDAIRTDLAIAANTYARKDRRTCYSHPRISVWPCDE